MPWTDSERVLLEGASVVSVPWLCLYKSETQVMDAGRPGIPIESPMEYNSKTWRMYVDTRGQKGSWRSRSSRCTHSDNVKIKLGLYWDNGKP